LLAKTTRPGCAAFLPPNATTGALTQGRRQFAQGFGNFLPGQVGREAKLDHAAWAS